MYFLSLDLEMTGGEPGWHEVIQIGACLYDENWKEQGRYLQNVYPENEDSYSESAYKVHELSLKDLENAPMMHDVIPEFENWILKQLKFNLNVISERDKQRALKKVIICGQSVVNDINFLRFAYRKEKLQWPFSYKMVDLHTLSFYLFTIFRNNEIDDTPRSLSLESVANYFGYKRETTVHNALEDAVLTGKCFKEVFAYAKELYLPEEEED